ncbi:hypothetical protein ACJJVH_04930 [Rhizobium sp. SYY.PMSO]
MSVSGVADAFPRMKNRGAKADSVNCRIRFIEERPDPIARDSCQELVKSFAVGREGFLPFDQILLRRDDLHPPIGIGAGWTKDIDQNGHAVIGEFTREFGVF